ncbi:MAG: PAS domain-containing sensor histidine kinase [Candidatus Sericytochromatia bacterium]
MLTLAAAAPCFLTLNSAHHIQDISSGFFEATGFAPQALLGKSFDSVFHWHHPQGQRLALSEIQSGETLQLCTHTGERTWLQPQMVSTQTGQCLLFLWLGESQSLKKLEQAQIKLATAENLTAIGSRVSHFKTGEHVVSDGYFRIFGLEPDSNHDLESFFPYLHPEDHARVRESLDKALQTGGPFKINTRIIRADQAVRHIKIKGFIECENGEAVSLRSALQDVTELFEAHARQLRLQQTFELFFQHAPLLMGIVKLEDDDILHISDNPATYRFFGAPPGSLDQRRASELGTPPLILAQWQKLYDSVRTTGREQRMEYDHPQPDGTSARLQVTAAPLDKAAGLYGYIAEDISQRHLTELKLRESQQRFLSLFETMYTFMGLLTPEGVLLEANPVALEFAQTTLAQVQGLYFWEAPWWQVDEPTRLELQSAIARAAQGEFVRYEVDIATPQGGTTPIDFSIRPLLDETGKVVALIPEGRDISELKHKQAELERSNAELQQFAYIASHDLQEPLRKIMAFGERLESKLKTDLDPSAADYLKRMLAAAQRMQTLIQDLLSYSRVTTQGQALVPLRLNDLVEEVKDTLQLALEESRATLVCDTLPEIAGDASQIRQLFQNLLSNALKFVAPGKTPVIEIRSRQEAQSVVIEVQDQGIGFDPQYRDKIFQIFQRLHGRSEYPGSGIGLTLCRKIVERHGGTLEARSQPGQGACFVLKFPRRT